MKNKCFLIVDDDELIRETLADVVKLLYNTDVIEALNGQEALDIINSETRELILITDINMPIMNGFELVKEVRSKDKSIPIIMMSGYIENERIQDKEFPDIKFFGKPVDFDALKTHIDGL